MRLEVWMRNGNISKEVSLKKSEAQSLSSTGDASIMKKWGTGFKIQFCGLQPKGVKNTQGHGTQVN
jgi:hypothetical protein